MILKVNFYCIIYLIVDRSLLFNLFDSCVIEFICTYCFDEMIKILIAFFRFVVDNCNGQAMVDLVVQWFGQYSLRCPVKCPVESDIKSQATFGVIVTASCNAFTSSYCKK